MGLEYGMNFLSSRDSLVVQSFLYYPIFDLFVSSFIL
jgi:hypothetical protein